MTELVLQRENTHATLDATPGEVFLDDQHLCWSMELPWRGNEHDRSCIPPGTYALGQHFRTIGGLATLHLEHVPDRAGILIHIANWPHEINGCIGVGKQRTIMGDKYALIRSAQAMREVLLAKPTSITIKAPSNT